MLRWIGALLGAPAMAAHTIDGFGRFRMPKPWAALGAEVQGRGVVQQFCRAQRWHWGAGTPLEAQAFVVLATPEASTAWLEQTMRQAFAQVQAKCLCFDEFGSIQTGTRTTWISQGNYQIASNHDPERVIFLRSIYADRRAALVMRVHERRIPHEVLRRIEHRFFNSLQVVAVDGPRPAHRVPATFTAPDMDKVAFNVRDSTVLVMDQLRPWRIYTLEQALRTVDGRECPAGLRFRFENARVNQLARTARINGLGPDDERLSFDSQGDEHRHWFTFTGEEWRPGPRPGVPSRTDVLEPVTGPFDPAAVPAGHERALAIMAGEFSPSNWGSLQNDADTLRHAALALAGSHPQAARHIADRSLHLYHAWMAQATSGGEGAAMQYQVRSELQQLRRMLGEG